MSPAVTSCQRWRDRRLSWQLADPAERFDARNYDVAPIDEATARSYVETHHYSGTYPAASRRYGLHRAGRLVGVAVYSIPAQARVLTGPLPDLIPYRESLELGRLVLDQAEPGNTESWFVARCHEDLVEHGVRGVVSFSDPVPRYVDGRLVMPGHIGYLYQALNAHYTGRGTARSLSVMPSGTILSERARQKVRAQDQGHGYVERMLVAAGARPLTGSDDPAAWLAEAETAVGVTRLRHPGNHRYVFQLGRNRRARDRVRLGMELHAYPKTLAA